MLRNHLNLVTALGVFTLTALLSWTYLDRVGLGAFYQDQFSPAVTLACTGKMHAVAEPAADATALQDFLAGKANTLDCSNVGVGSRKNQLNNFQQQTLYLMALTGAVWSVVGVSWGVITVIAALLAGVFVTSVYGISRLFSLPVAVSAAVASLTALSPLHIQMLPHVRDYSKAAFIAAFAFFACQALSSFCDRQRPVLATAAAALVAALGFGFRADLALAIPLFCIVLVLCVASAGRTSWRKALALGAVFACVFFVSVLPIVAAYSGGGFFGHVTLLGLTLPFNEKLDLSEQIYDIGHLYNDAAIHDFVQANAYMRGDQGSARSDLGFLTSDYKHESIRALTTFALNFPADVLIRIYASILRVTELGITVGNKELTPNFIVVIREHMSKLSGAMVIGFGIFIASIYSVTSAMFLLIFLVYFGGLGSLQHDLRHIFYLEFLFWLSAGLAMHGLWRTSVKIIYARLERNSTQAGQADRIQHRPLPRVGVAIGRGVLIGTLCLLCATLALVGARSYQQESAARLIGRYLKAPREPVQLSEEYAHGQATLKPVGSLRNMRGEAVQVSQHVRDGFYLVADLDAEQCAGRTVPVNVAYKADDAFHDFSRSLSLHLDPAKGPDYRILFPIVNSSYHHFEGLALPADLRKCLRQLEAVKEPGSLPLPLWLQVPPDWEKHSLYQVLRNPVLLWWTKLWSGAPAEAEPSIHIIGPAPELMEMSATVGEADWTAVPPTKVEGSSVTLQGKPATPAAYGVVSKPYSLKEGVLVVASGQVRKGGLVLGLLDSNEKWAATVAIPPVGRFRAAVAVPTDGDYKIVVANNLSSTLKMNDAKISEVGLVGHDMAFPPEAAAPE